MKTKPPGEKKEKQLKTNQPYNSAFRSPRNTDLMKKEELINPKSRPKQIFFFFR